MFQRYLDVLLAVFWMHVFDHRTRGSHREYWDVKFPQVFAAFSAQSSSTYDNKDDINNQPSTGEMSMSETPQTY